MNRKIRITLIFLFQLWTEKSASKKFQRPLALHDAASMSATSVSKITVCMYVRKFSTLSHNIGFE